jgi:Pyridoxamine 5'-phosphate oxidase
MLGRVTTWSEFEAAAPELAARAQQLFEAQKHLTIATLRRDGSPRISGIECTFEDGDLWFGSMRGAVKALDLQRDPRFALHSGTGDSARWEGDPGLWPGDAKVSGRAEEVESHRFRAEIEEVVTVRLGGSPPDHLLIDSWREGSGLRQIRR